ncbi:MAG: amino acid adenylation domain-containing protein [Clostridia bacterium]|nr:amino acid adenylation domain-containing protein [Clostridia bacterium]
MFEENNREDYFEMSVSDFVTEIGKKKIKLWVDNGALRYKAPKGSITDGIQKFIIEKKAEIIAFFETQDEDNIFYQPIVKIEESENYSLSAAQQRMYIMTLSDKDSTAYNLTQVLKIHGDFDRTKFSKVIEKLAQRHEPLRTSFELRDGEPIQRVHSKVELSIEYQELEDGEENLEAVIKDFIRPFDLSKLPLFRFKLVKLKSSGSIPIHILIQDMHHLISDGISESILVKEINDLYAGKGLPELRIQYKDYVYWHRRLLKSNLIQAQKTFWHEQLKGEIPALDIPADYMRPQVFSFQGDTLKIKIEYELKEKLNKFAREKRITLFTLLLAVYNLLLANYSGQNDIIVGSPTAGRRHADTYSVLGVFVNTLVFRNFPEPDKSFEEFLKEVGSNVLKVFDNQDYPFEQLVDELKVKRDLSRNPIFDAMFILQNMRIDEIKAEGLDISRYDYKFKMAQYDLSFIATESKNEIELEINYYAGIFKRQTIERLGRHFINILENAINNPEAKLCEIDMLTPEEKENAVYRINNTDTEYPKSKTIHEQFEEQVKNTPESPAAVFHGNALTYADLNKRVNQIAWTLRKKGVKPDSIVGIMTGRSVDMVVAIMAVLKAGGAYLPIDPDYPMDRVTYMLEDSGAQILLTQSSLLDRLGFSGSSEAGAGLSGIDLVNLEDEKAYCSETGDPEIVNTSEDLAYVIYTSGSTGKPKGVMIEHKAVSNFIKGVTDRIDFSKGKSILALTTISFDIHVLEILLPLTKGLRIVIADEMQQRDSKLLNEVIDINNVEMLQITPSRMQLLLKGASSLSCLKKLKIIMIGGEAFPQNLLLELKGLTDSRIYNMYGPTETTVWSTISELSGAENIDVGKPIANTRVYVLNKAKKAVPVGVAGELCIAGDGLARGYLNRPELTAEKFIDDPFHESEKMYCTGDMARLLHDGRLECLGRVDQQVKIRGYRIEPGEIEKHLSRFEGIRECAVVAKEDQTGIKFLVAYYSSPAEISLSDLRNHLSKSLPEYMVPDIYVHMDKLPSTPNGKIDRKALPEPDFNRPKLSSEYKGAETEAEKVLADIWGKVLKRDLIGVDDNFFELGGNSLLLVMMHAELEKHYPGKVNVADIFAHPSISKLAEMIEGGEEITISDVKFQSLKIVPEYFTDNEEENENTIINLKLDSETSIALVKAAEKHSTALSDVLLGAYVYLFYELSGKEEIPISLVLEGTERVMPMEFELGGLKDIRELIKTVAEKREKISKNDSLPLKYLRNIRSDKQIDSVFLLFSHNSGTIDSDHTNYFDIILKARIENDILNLTFEYDANRIRKEKIDELAYYYVEVIDSIIERMI